MGDKQTPERFLVHTGKGFYCDLCSFEVASTYIHRHLKNHHGLTGGPSRYTNSTTRSEDKKTRGGKTFHCNGCQKSFKRRYNYLRHCKGPCSATVATQSLGSGGHGIPLSPLPPAAVAGSAAPRQVCFTIPDRTPWLTLGPAEVVEAMLPVIAGILPSYKDCLELQQAILSRTQLVEAMVSQMAQPLVDRVRYLIFQHAPVVTNMLLGNIRSELLNFSNTSILGADDRRSAIFHVRHDNNAVFSELMHLIAYFNVNIETTNVVTYISTLALGTSTNHLVDIPPLCHYCFFRSFKLSGGFRSPGAIASVCATILHLIRLMFGCYLATFSGNDVIEHQLIMARKLRSSFFVNWISPLIRRLREVEALSPTRVMDVVRSNGDIVISGFTFPAHKWRQFIPLWMDATKQLLYILLGKGLTDSLLSSPTFQVTNGRRMTWTCEDINSTVLKSRCVPMGNAASLDDHQQEQEKLLIQLASYIEVAIHGLGYGPMRQQELLQLDTARCQFVDGCLWYWAKSNKQGGVRCHGGGRLVQHRLPRCVSRVYLLVFALCAPSSCEEILPIHTHPYGIGWAVAKLFDFHSTPSATDVRHFWTEVVNLTFGKKGEKHIDEYAATQAGHSAMTHHLHYTTDLEVSDQFRCFHKAVGDVDDDHHHGGVKVVKLDLSHCRYVASRVFGEGQELRRDQEILLGKILEGDGHIHASLPCGWGKSSMFFILAKAQEHFGLHPSCSLVVLPYSFLVCFFAQQADKLGIDCVVLSTSNFGGTNICPVTLQDGLPSLLVMTVDCFDKLASCGNYLSLWCQQKLVSRIFVDEIHTPLLEFGFRRAYESLPTVAALGVPVITLSATLTEEMEDVITKWIGTSPALTKVPSTDLGLDGIPIDVEVSNNPADSLLEFCTLRKRKGGIHIFCSSRSDVDTVVTKIGHRYPLDPVLWVTSETPTRERENVSKRWAEAADTFLVSTTSCLVGNENRLCRTILFLGSIHSLPSFVQGVGRLRPRQREGCQVTVFWKGTPPKKKQEKPSPVDCKAYFGSTGKGVAEFVSEDPLYDFYRGAACRQVMLNRFFGFQVQTCGICDNCRFIPRKNKNYNLGGVEGAVTATAVTAAAAPALPAPAPAPVAAPATAAAPAAPASIKVAVSQAHFQQYDGKQSALQSQSVLSHLRKMCLVCRSENCDGESCVDGVCYACGSPNHQRRDCPKNFKALLSRKACYSCLDFHGREIHKIRRCPMQRRLWRLIVQEFGQIPPSIGSHYVSIGAFYTFVENLVPLQDYARQRGYRDPPYLPPDHFDCRMASGTVDLRRQRWVDSLPSPSRCVTNRVASSWTSSIDPTLVDIIDPVRRGSIAILEQGNGRATMLSWHVSTDNQFNKGCMQFVTQYTKATCRMALNEPGGMAVVGRNAKGATVGGTQGYRPVGNTFGEIASKYICKHFPTEYAQFEKENGEPWLGFPTRRVVVSKNLMNSIHLDPADTTRSVAAFVACQRDQHGTVKVMTSTSQDKEDGGWYLVFSHSSRDGKRCLAILLRNFTVISWDGRTQLHHTVLSPNLTRNLRNDEEMVQGYYSVYFGGSKY